MASVSVIIPAYNEERRLTSTLDSVYGYLKNSGHKFEIIVVDDGSLDHTVSIVESFAQTHSEVRPISYLPNRGKGYAVKVGMLAAQGEYLLFDDADGSSPIAEVEQLIQAIEKGADIAIGSRNLPQAGRAVATAPHRKFIGNTFNFIVQSLLLPGINDTQCGFKLFKRAVARDIFSVTQLDGFAFDVELLYIARLRGYKVAEIAIDWTNMPGSKVNVLTDSPKMLFDVIDISIGSLFGRYKKLSDKQAHRLGLNHDHER